MNPVNWLAAAALAAAFGVGSATAADTPRLKVEIYKPDLVYPGTTAFMDGADFMKPKIIEIDFQGHILWSYDVPSSLVTTDHESSDLDWLPNDHFLFVRDLAGVFEVDRNKNIVWSYRTLKISHDADRLPNGNTLFTYGFDQHDDAQVTEVDPGGKIVWQWFAGKALPNEFAKTPGRKDAKAIVRGSKASGAGKAGGIAAIAGEGFTHANGATRLPNGNTVVSLRNLHRIVEVNPAGEVVWSDDHANGTHAPEVLANGNILINHSGGARVAEVTRTGEVVWHFSLERYGSSNRYAHRLPNGNTLILTQNRLIEVTPAGEVAWLVHEMDIPDEESRREMVGYASWDKDHRSLYSASRIPQRDSPEWGKWWDDPANRPPMGGALASRGGRPGLSNAPAANGLSGAGAPPAARRPSSDGLFGRFDANGDGMVTEPEFLAARRATFGQMDADRDGVVTRAEYDAGVPPAMPPQMRATMFGHLDADGDGRLSPDEIDAASREVFHHLDSGRTGKVTPEAFAALRMPPPVLLFGVPPGGGGEAAGPAAQRSRGARGR